MVFTVIERDYCIIILESGEVVYCILQLFFYEKELYFIFTLLRFGRHGSGRHKKPIELDHFSIHIKLIGIKKGM